MLFYKQVIITLVLSSMGAFNFFSLSSTCLRASDASFTDEEVLMHLLAKKGRVLLDIITQGLKAQQSGQYNTVYSVFFLR